SRLRSGLSSSQHRQQQQQQQLESSVLSRASSWLWSAREEDAGWANDTHRALLALRLSELPSSASPRLRLSAKQMELEVVLMLWRHRDLTNSALRLAGYSLALSSMCIDPRQFHGYDLVGALQHHDPASDYEFALGLLAACNAQAHVRKRQMRRLLDIAHSAHNHNIDTVAMSITTLRCIVQDHRHRNLQHFIRKPLLSLAQRQRRDGSFGDIRNTALALQALEEVENEPLDNWNRSAALNWLSSQQAEDGSFKGQIDLTADVVLGLAPTGLATIRVMDCSEKDNEEDEDTAAATDMDAVKTSIPSESNIATSSSEAQPTIATPLNSGSAMMTSSGSSQTTTSSKIDSKIPLIATTTNSTKKTASETILIGEKQPQLVNVTYTLWVGSDVDEIYNLSLSAPKNETFYEVMVLAAQRSQNFQFSAYEWPNGHYVHTLAGYKEEPMSYHYWLLYRLPAPPEPSSPPGNQLVAPGGVDDLQISNGEHYLFWYKKL
ncbi:hypothetical protein QAD02_009744, partial [Eretmocerus hayati]